VAQSSDDIIMPSQLIKTSAKILGGSAIAGFGLSFGRDVYKTSKKNLKKIGFILLLAGLLIGTYTGGVWLARNYETIWGSIFKRIGALILLVPCFLVLMGISGFAFILVSETGKGSTPQEITRAEPAYGSASGSGSLEQAATGDIELEDLYLLRQAFYLPGGILLIGLIAGSIQRKKRRDVWEAEHANEQFMTAQGLVEHEDGTIEEESTGQHYRIDHVGSRRITLFPIGRRGRRAYINIDTDGKYSEFTGLMSLND
jgi:hypothetical protein